MIKKAIDYIQLYFQFPSTKKVFLRHQYDFFYPVLNAGAYFYRRTMIPKKKFIAVIGSLGKTTTMRALRTAFHMMDRKQSWSNYGSCLAENILRSRKKDPYDVFEVGIDRFGEMASYARLINPDIVVVTSIKSEHNRTFQDLNGFRNFLADINDIFPFHPRIESP